MSKLVLFFVLSTFFIQQEAFEDRRPLDQIVKEMNFNLDLSVPKLSQDDIESSLQNVDLSNNSDQLHLSQLRDVHSISNINCDVGDLESSFDTSLSLNSVEASTSADEASTSAYEPPSDSSFDEIMWKEGNVKKKEKNPDLLTQLLAKEGLPKARKKLSDMTRQTQKKYIDKSLNLVRKIPQAIFKDTESQRTLEKSYAESMEWSTSTSSIQPKLPPWIEEVILAYNNVKSRNSHDRHNKQIERLSELTDTYEWSQIEPFKDRFDPQLAIGKWLEAKKNYLRHKHAGAEYERKLLIERVPPIVVQEIVNYVTEHDIMNPNAHGTGKIIDSEENITIVPTMTATEDDTTIVKMTKQHLEEKKLKASESTIRRVLSVLPHRKRHALTNVNPFQAKAMKRFKQLKEAVDVLDNHGAIKDPEEKKAILDVLEDSEYYMKSILRHEVIRESDVSSHCILHGLSDGSKSMSEDCKNVHDSECATCNNIPLVVKLIDGLVEENKDKMAPIQYNKLKFVTWKAYKEIAQFHGHILQSQNQNRNWSAESSKSIGDMAFAIADFPQQYLPNYINETQVQYFSKAGFNWHMLQLKIMEQENQFMHSFPTIFLGGKVSQDSHLILPMLEEEFKVFSKAHPEVKFIQLKTGKR